MNVKLTDLLEEDAAVGKELALLVRALEVVTDINIVPLVSLCSTCQREKV